MIRRFELRAKETRRNDMLGARSESLGFLLGVCEMPYLHRRIAHLGEMLRNGRLHLPDTAEMARTVAELKQIQRDSMGRPDLTTCSPRVRSLARMMYRMRDMWGDDTTQTTEPKERP